MSKETPLQLGNIMADLLCRLAYDPMIPLMSDDKRTLLEIVRRWENTTLPAETSCEELPGDFIACRCCSDEQKRLCQDKSKCSECYAAAEDSGGKE